MRQMTPEDLIMPRTLKEADAAAAKELFALRDFCQRCLDSTNENIQNTDCCDVMRDLSEPMALAYRQMLRAIDRAIKHAALQRESE